MKFLAVQEFPLDLVSRLETDGGGEGHGEADIQAGVLSAGADGLDPQGIGGLHLFL